MTDARALDDRAPRQFWFGGFPFPRVLERLHLAHDDGTPRAWPLVAFAWIPLFVGAVLRVLIGDRPSPILYDFSIHARLLLALPLMISGERLFAQRCRGAVLQLYRGEFADRATLDRVLDRAERLRDSRTAVIAVVALAVFGGQAPLWGIVGPTGVFSGRTDAGGLSFARVWYGFVAQPIVLFFTGRWLWQWIVWSFLVVRLARMKLAIIATHPDHAGGIEFLAGPVGAFAFFVTGFACQVAAAWATELVDTGVTVQSFIPAFVVMVISTFVVACGPYFAYMPVLYRERHRAIPEYNELALRYTRAFQDKWVESGAEPQRAKEHLLGTSDIQSLNDLIGSYEALVRVRLVPFGARAVLRLWAAVALPMIPLALLVMPVQDVLGRLGKLMLGAVG